MPQLEQSARSLAQPGVQSGPADLRDSSNLDLRQARPDGLACECPNGFGFTLSISDVVTALGRVEDQFSSESVGVHDPIVKHLTRPVDRRKVVYMAKYSEDEFYEIIEEALNESPEDRKWPFYAMDYIASIGEWDAFKAAMTRWMEEKETEMVAGFFQYVDENPGERPDEDEDDD